MNFRNILIIFIFLWNIFYKIPVCPAFQPKIPLSETSEECLSCHRLYSPGIFSDWKKSRHAGMTIQKALQRPENERRISLNSLNSANDKGRVAVGCAECHTINPTSHKDTFQHNGYEVHIVVSPADCACCHPKETAQYTNNNKMAHAYGNLYNNSFFNTLRKTLGAPKWIQSRLPEKISSSASTEMDICYGCHGTHVKVLGMKEIETPVKRIKVPLLSGWPNIGVGRVNPDNSVGSCTSCHSRHAFSIATARQPYVCRRCHHGTKAPAWGVYEESKHGQLYFSQINECNFEAVPWQLGKDFHVPNCAICHSSLIKDPAGAVLIERTHGYSERLWTRLFGLIYSHAQPILPNTSFIRNQDGQPLPITFKGEPADRFLISANEQLSRKSNMKNLCLACHSTQWVLNHFNHSEKIISYVDEAVKAGTELIQQSWKAGEASPANPFDEPLETLWLEQWLYCANSIRYASAMAGTPDYVNSKNSWPELTKSLQLLQKYINKKKAP